MHVMTTGLDNAPPALLLHGGGVAGWMWNSLRPHLESTHTVLVPDLPGHGRSHHEPYVSHERTVDALADLLRRSTGGKALVVGFSLGAQLAIELAARHPDLVADTVVVSAQAKPIRFTVPLLRALGVTAPLARQRWFATVQARELFIPPDLLEEYVRTSAGITRQTLIAAVEANLRFELPEGWARFPGRALVLAGRRERRLMRESATDIHAALPGSTLEVVEGCGHGIPLQRPDWFAGRLRAWLSER